MYMFDKKLETTECEHQGKTTKKGYTEKDQDLFIRLTAYNNNEYRSPLFFYELK